MSSCGTGLNSASAPLDTGSSDNVSLRSPSSCITVREQDEHKSTPLHPIARLPSEVLSLVFLNCLPHAPTFSPKSAPLLLTHVCSSWRALALSTPALWDTLTIPAPEATGFLATDIRLVEVFLRRSGTRRLNIDLGIAAGEIPWQRSEHHQNRLIEALIPHAWRIKTLENVTSAQLLQRFTLSRLPNLEHLLVTDDDDPKFRLVRYPSEARFPESLQVLDLHRTTLNLQRLSPPSSLSELYVRSPVGLGCISVASALTLLSTLSSLESCSLDISIPSDATMAHSLGHLPRATMPRLTELRLHWGQSINVAPLLDLVDMPRLCTLSLWGHHSTLTPWAELADFAARCHPPMVSISLVGTGTIDPGFVECLHVWRDLESLTLTEYELDSTFLEALIPKPDEEQDPLVPFLEYLDFEWCSFPDFESFVRLLEARGKRNDVPGNRLEYFRMSTNALTKGEMERVNECGIENVDIRRY